MKKAVCVFTALMTALILTACGGGNVDSVQVADWKPSEIYTDSEIEAAVRTVKAYFKKEFEGCTLLKVGYAGDSSSEEFAEWAEQYGADEAIVLYSSFYVAPSGGDGSLEPDSTYDDWKWILVRDGGGSWRHVDHGY